MQACWATLLQKGMDGCGQIFQSALLDRLLPRGERRFVIVARADPVICGHSTEARNLAEAALCRGFAEVRIVTWPLEVVKDLPQKPLDKVRPYSTGIVVERPEPVGDYKFVDSRFSAGLVGRLVELFTDGVPTVCLSLYLMPHASIVEEARRTATALRGDVPVITCAEAVGSDITCVIRNCLTDSKNIGAMGAAASAFATYLGSDLCVAVSEYTRDLIIDLADDVDRQLGTTFGCQCRKRISVSYPAINSSDYTGTGSEDIDDVLGQRGLERDGYVLFLSRVTPAKGVDDLLDGFAASAARERARLVVAGRGNALEDMKLRASDLKLEKEVMFLEDVGDQEKNALMAGCAAYVLPSKPRPEFVETFGIALAEKMLSGGGPVITTATGGIPEAVGDTAMIVSTGAPAEIAAALDKAVLNLWPGERVACEKKARAYALQFDRQVVFDRLFGFGASELLPEVVFGA